LKARVGECTSQIIGTAIHSAPPIFKFACWRVYLPDIAVFALFSRIPLWVQAWVQPSSSRPLRAQASSIGLLIQVCRGPPRVQASEGPGGRLGPWQAEWEGIEGGRAGWRAAGPGRRRSPRQQADPTAGKYTQPVIASPAVLNEGDGCAARVAGGCNCGGAAKENRQIK
jgi:hypothetical protein